MIVIVNWINSWTQGIIISVIISTIIEMIIPNGNIKKYIKTVIGVYIVFVIISPIISKVTGKDISISEYIDFDLEQYAAKEAVIDTNSYIKETYVNNIKQDITKNLEQMGYIAKNIKIEIEENEEQYGKINKITMQVSNKINDIQPIEISVNGKTTKEDEEIAEAEVQKIKDFLETNYGIEQKQILIN